MPEEAEGTADFILFVDKLFDSVNGSLLIPEFGKPLRSAIKENSQHHKFYEEAVSVLNSMKFISAAGKTMIPPTVKNFIKTLKGILNIWKICKSEGDFEFLCPRNLNQDPLENFFSVIRSHGARNINPSCPSFRSSFKALVINNFFSVHSPNANCEQDDCVSGIESFKTFLEGNNENMSVTKDNVDENQIYNFKLSVNKSQVIKKENAYIAGYIAKKILKTIGCCKVCQQSMITQQREEIHDYIALRSYGPNTLLMPNTYFVFLYNMCTEIVHYFLPKIYNCDNLNQRLVQICKQKIINVFFCTEHDLLSIFLDNFVCFYIFTWIKNINNILKGFCSSKINDEVKIAALQYHKVHKAKKRAVDKTKLLV